MATCARARALWLAVLVTCAVGHWNSEVNLHEGNRRRLDIDHDDVESINAKWQCEAPDTPKVRPSAYFRASGGFADDTPRQ